VSEASRAPAWIKVVEQPQSTACPGASLIGPRRCASELNPPHYILAQNRKGNRLEFEVQVPPILWRKFYWSNKRLLRYVGGYLTGSANVLEIDRALLELPLNQLGEVIQTRFGDNTDLNTAIENRVAALENSPQPAHQNAAYIIRACLTFTWKVILPCMLHYERMPLNLYRAARNGDNQALDQLLRLDKSAVTIPAIARRWNEIMTRGNTELRQMMQDAIAGKSGRALESKQLKMMMMALVQFAGEFCGYRVSTEEIRALLDAIDKDRTNDARSFDLDIPDKDDSLAKALRRARDRWMEAIGIRSTVLP
jgi:hypothetical protein